ncbi:MAG: DUF1353 domain-containing protein [Pirellulales bacterium]
MPHDANTSERDRREPAGGGPCIPRGDSDAARSGQRPLQESEAIAGLAGIFLPPLSPTLPELFPGCELLGHEWKFGDVALRFVLPRGLEDPIAWNLRGVGRGKWFRTLTWHCYEYAPPNRPPELEPYRLWIPPAYEFDGASTPRKLWSRKQFAPVEISIVAALPHDYVCDHPEVLPRYAGDAIFGHILDQLAIEHQLEVREAIEFHSAVSIYSRIKNYMLGK